MSSSALFGFIPLHSKLGSLPAMIYGTAWKKTQTTLLVVQALNNGFTSVDTACQPRHYREDLVGQGVREYLTSNPQRSRGDLFIQTKFTSTNGQDPNNCPYDRTAELEEQVRTSVATSLKNFTINDSEPAYLDSLVLHSPMSNINETMRVWTTLEEYVPDKIRNLGISNTPLFTLMDLYERARIKPTIVQNRFHAETKYDIALRSFCREKGIVYQSFWTLTANPNLLRSRVVNDLARNLGVEGTSALYALVLGLGGTTILNGSKSVEHIRGDWEALRKAKEFAEKDAKRWEDIMIVFRRTIGEKAQV